MRFPSGIAGVVVITLALMGSIGVGFLLNGASDYETVNDYDYITDVTGLYTYTPVAQYSNYSPAQNNYQYSETLEDLGTYTSGIDYTPAGAANLNPIITPSSGQTTYDQTFTLEELQQIADTIPGSVPSVGITYNVQSGASSMNQRSAAAYEHYMTLQDIANHVGIFSKIVIDIPTISMTVGTNTAVPQTLSIQSIALANGHPTITPGSSTNQIAEAMRSSFSTAAFYSESAGTAISNAQRTLGNGAVDYGACGTVSNLTILPNGTASYTYTYDGESTEVSAALADVQLFVYYSIANSNFEFEPIDYHRTAYIGLDYLDPNGGVSLTGTEAYWSNSGAIGSASWMFSRPSAASSYIFTGYDSTNAAITSWEVEYSSQWLVKYTDASGQAVTLRLGSSWPAIRVTDWYTGQISVCPVKSFGNFTSYQLGSEKVYATNGGGNEPIHHYKIEKDSGAMKFANVGTTVKTGNVPGAMYDASFNVANYFPDYQDVRIAFDSAAFVGSSVSVGSWSMIVDSAKFTGTFTVNGREYVADLTQPWSITWNPASDGVDMSFTQARHAGATTVEILSGDIPKIVNLGGQWVIDTDLYQVGTHLEEVYDWNFGNWGLDSSTFIICAMGLSALIAIGFKLARVPMGALDLIIVFVGNVIFWVIL